MTIHLNSEQERVIGQSIQAGLIGTADEAVEIGMKALRQRLEAYRRTSVSSPKNLAALFANSPFAGLNMDFERDKDTGRELEF